MARPASQPVDMNLIWFQYRAAGGQQYYHYGNRVQVTQATFKAG
jgi:hypothetical protein